MRAFIFAVGFWWVSILYVLMAALLALVPGRKGVRWAVKRYTKRVVQLMKLVGIEPEVRGRERLPPALFILAPKHSSYGDGFLMYVQFDDVAFVTGDHLERFPLVPKVLEKLGAIVIDNCGGPEARKDLAASFARAAEDKRIVLIYPEGIHQGGRAQAHSCRRVAHAGGVAVAGRSSGDEPWPALAGTGLCEYPGPAVIEFLDPIPPGLGKDEMVKALSDAIRTTHGSADRGRPRVGQGEWGGAADASDITCCER